MSDGKIISLHMSRIRCYELYPTWKILTITKPDVSVYNNLNHGLFKIISYVNSSTNKLVCYSEIFHTKF